MHYNTGILMWNLKKIRKDFPPEYIFHQAWEHPINIATFEEELFNVVFGESGILQIPAETYNYICTHERMFERPNFHICDYAGSQPGFPPRFSLVCAPAQTIMNAGHTNIFFWGLLFLPLLFYTNSGIGILQSTS